MLKTLVCPPNLGESPLLSHGVGGSPWHSTWDYLSKISYKTLWQVLSISSPVLSFLEPNNPMEKFFPWTPTPWCLKCVGARTKGPLCVSWPEFWFITWDIYIRMIWWERQRKVPGEHPRPPVHPPWCCRRRRWTRTSTPSKIVCRPPSQVGQLLINMAESDSDSECLYINISGLSQI